MGELSPWHWAIVAIVVFALFGYKKLPDATRAIGRSMRIFKSEVKGMHDDEPAKSTPQPAAKPAPSTPQVIEGSVPPVPPTATTTPPPAPAEQPAGAAVSNPSTSAGGTPPTAG